MTSSTRCKFVCTSVNAVGTADGSVASSHIKLEARYDENSDADRAFSKYTPCGSMEFHVNNPAVLPLFEAGKAFYVDLTPIEAVQPLRASAQGAAPRVTPADVDAAIVGETFTVLPSGRVTVCELTLRNGFTVRGESAVVCIENFNAEIGRSVARDNAKGQVWQLLGYALRERLHAQFNAANHHPDL